MGIQLFQVAYFFSEKIADYNRVEIRFQKSPQRDSAVTDKSKNNSSTWKAEIIAVKLFGPIRELTGALCRMPKAIYFSKSNPDLLDMAKKDFQLALTSMFSRVACMKYIETSGKTA